EFHQAAPSSFILIFIFFLQRDRLTSFRKSGVKKERLLIQHPIDSPKMMVNMNLNEERKAPLRNKDLTTKREMVVQYISATAKSGGLKNSRHECTLSSQEYVHELRSGISEEKLLNCLESLRVSLTSNPVSWVNNFGHEGLGLLLDVLEKLLDKRQQESIDKKNQHKLIQCLKAFMNNKYGLQRILGDERSLLLLARAIDPKQPNMMTETVKILSAICIVGEENMLDKILGAITIAAERNNGERFANIVEGLENHEALQLQVACMQFINALVTSPEELDFRVHLRNEFLRCGLKKILPDLKEKENEELDIQLKVFDENKEEDLIEMAHRLNDIKVEMEYPLKIIIIYIYFYHLLYNMLKETTSENYFLSILQHFLLIRNDYYPQYYKIIEECISQIVLHCSGMDPDFKCRGRLDVDFTHLVDSCVNKAKVEESEQKAADFSKKFDEEFTARQEAQAELQMREEKIRQLEAEIQQLRTQNAMPAGDAPASTPDPSHVGLYKLQPAANAGRAGGPHSAPAATSGWSAREVPCRGHWFGVFKWWCSSPPSPTPSPIARWYGSSCPSSSSSTTTTTWRFTSSTSSSSSYVWRCGATTTTSSFGVIPSVVPAPVLPFGMKPKKKFNLDVTMKRINWSKVEPHEIQEHCFWVKAKDEKFENLDLFAKLALTFATQKKEKKTVENVEEKKIIMPKKKVKELRILDGKTAQNLSIFLGSFRMPYEEIKHIILGVDEAKLSEALIQNLVKNLPEQKELNALAELKNEYEDLCESEQFGVVMSSVKLLQPRLNGILFKLTFEEHINNIKPGIMAVTIACEELKKSESFSRLLELVLMIGNYMNSGSRNAQSLGFNISFLCKIRDTKSTDQKTTLLHFLADICEEKYQDILKFPDELEHVESASKVSAQSLKSNLDSMGHQIQRLENDIKKFPKIEDPHDKFVEKMIISFCVFAREQYEKLSNMHNNMVKLYDNLGDYYAFDSKSVTIEEFFGDLSTFRTLFLEALKENHKRREMEEKTKRAKLAKEKAEREKLERQKKKKQLIDMNKEGDETGVMDNLLEALQSGEAFRDRRKRMPRPQGRTNNCIWGRGITLELLFESIVVVGQGSYGEAPYQFQWKCLLV
uniref:Diaphanous related formin 2 n=1 Tax=Naja naja TaxID=35670 RepID=A0A8C6Y8I4_NAJNA